MKFTIFLSTDGKHTVQGEAETQLETSSVNVRAQELYDEIVGKYGTKQEQTVKAYTPKPAFPNDTGSVAVTQEKAHEGLGVCSKCGAPNLLSKAGKTYCSKKCWL